MDSSSIARPCLIEEDESCFSKNKHKNPLPLLFQTSSSSSSLCCNKRTSTSFKSYGFSCPRFNKARYELLHNNNTNQDPHFLASCFLCNKLLAGNRDIFMYRGDTPFCSEECRQEQIDIDEAKEKKLNLSMKALRIMKDQTRHSSPPSKTTHGYSYRTGTVVAT